MAQAKILPPAAYLQECFDYDPATGALTWRMRPRAHFSADSIWRWWNARFSGKRAGGVNAHGARTIALDGIRHYEHRLIWKMQTGEEPSDTIDHKDRDPADNRWEAPRH